jgi:hypothetical protein
MAEENGGGTVFSAEKSYVIGAYVAVGVSILVAILLSEKNDVAIEVGEGFAPFAVIYIVAQAIERFIQPFTGFTVKAAEKSEAKAALAEGGTEAGKAAAEKKRLEVIEADRAVAFWAVATCLALVICGALELGLIQSVASVSGDAGGAVPKWFNDIDVVLTGIAVGSGTKPLHDLIAFIQNAKQKADPAASGAAG